jgi:hypothetical protein
MALLDGKQLRGQSTSLDKLQGHSGLVTFTASATMSFQDGAVLRRATADILIDTDVVNKEYVDSVAAGLDPKESVRVIAATGAISLSGVGQVIDGYTVESGDRILVNSQAGPGVATASNGIYSATAGAWERAIDSDGAPSHEVSLGNFAFVEEGSIYSGSGWVLSVSDSPDSPILVGTESQLWVQFSAAGAYTAGTGLTLTGSEFSITDTTVTANSYGGAGTVGTFTVNSQGQLTAASDVLIDITASQVSDFNTSSETAIFTDSNFVDGITVTFSVTAGDSVTAEVVDGSLGTVKLNTGSNGGATAGYILSNDGAGNFNWIINDEGDITDVIAATGITGGGSFGSVELQVEGSNGITSTDSGVKLGGTLDENTTLNAATFDFTIGDAGTILMTSSVFDVEADGFISLDAGTGSVQVLADDNITISSSNSVDIATVGDLNLTFDNGNVTDSGSGLGLVYTSDYSGTFVTNSLITKAYVDAQVLSAGTITEILGGDGMIGGGTGGSITLDVVGGTGINVNPNDIEIDFTAVASGLAGDGLTNNVNVLDVDYTTVATQLTGDGLTQSAGVMSVDFVDITSTIAGDGLTSSGTVLDVQVDTTGLNINGSNQVALNTTITGDRTFADSVTIQGNLIVEGTQSIINTENLYIEDNIITLNATYSGPYNVVDAGIEANLGGGTYATLIWDASESLWAVGLSGSTSTIITEAGTGLTKSGDTLSIDTTLLAGDLSGAGLTSSGGVINVGAGTGITVNADDVAVDFTVVAETIQGNGLSASAGTLNIIGGTGIGVDADGVYLEIENITGQGLTQSGGVISVDESDLDYTTIAGNLDGPGLIVSGTELAVNTGLGMTISGDTVATDLLIDGGLTYSGNQLTVDVDNTTIQIINGQLVATTQGDITAVEAGAGLTGGSTSGTASLSIDFVSITGTGLTQNGSQIDVDYTAVAIQLAGDGLSDNGGVIDVNAGAGITISSDAVSIDLATNSGLNTTSGLSIDPSVAGTGLSFSGGVLSVVAGSAQPVYQAATSITQNAPNVNNFDTNITITSTPNDYSRVNVFVNGQLQRLGDGVTTTDCYFGTQSGSAVNITDIEVGYTLFWNGLNAGFRINASDDIDIIYEA